MTDPFSRSCLTCRDYRLGAIAHTEGAILIFDCTNLPVCVNEQLQKKYVLAHFPAEMKARALENIPLPMPVNVINPAFCRMRYWQEIPSDQVKSEVRQ